MVKKPPDDIGDTRDTGSIPGFGRSPGEGHGNPLQYSCIDSLVDRGAWQATVHRVTQSWTRLKQLSILTVIMQLPMPFNYFLKLPEIPEPSERDT